MEGWSRAALLCSLAVLCTAGDPQNGTDALHFDEQVDSSYKPPAAEILASLLEKGVLDVEKGAARGATPKDSFLDNKSRSGTKAKKPQIKPPVSVVPTGVVASSASPNSQADRVPPSEGEGESRINGENKSPGCVGCVDDVYANRKSPSRSLLSEQSDAHDEPVTSFVWPVGQGTVDMEFRKSFAKGDRPSMAESQEDSGSGDAKMPSGQVTHSSSLETGWNLQDFMDLATSTPSQTSTAWSIAMLSPSTEKAISPDSAEIDHLLQVSRETSMQSPSPSGTEPSRDGLDKSQKEASYEAGKSQGPFTTLEKDSRQSAAQGAQWSTDNIAVTEKSQVDTLSTDVPANDPPKPSEPPSDFADIDYRDPSDLDEHLGYPPGGDFHSLSPWHKHLHYDAFSHFDYLYPTPPFYADGYEEVGNEDDDDDEDLEDSEDDDFAAKDIQNFPKAATPKIHIGAVDEKPTSRQDFPFHGETYPKSQPELNKDQTQSMPGTGENGTECRNGYVRRNNSCKSLCEIYPTYCYNGGQCYIVENIGAFCRCNTQDYIWHKGLRCESIITDFQVMCVAVGTAALVVLLLFMMTVFFAKKLYLLKTENYKLRKRNRYRTPSELHNDNFSLSTIAEGSHPNEDPNAPQKVQDLPKACLKDEEPFNIQNSLSPKHECSKGDPDIVDVNCVLNNLT